MNHIYGRKMQLKNCHPYSLRSCSVKIAVGEEKPVGILNVLQTSIYQQNIMDMNGFVQMAKGEPMSDFEKFISTSDLIEWIIETFPDWCLGDVRLIVDHVGTMPSAQSTLYGYNIEHLELIARILQKEDLPPERVGEALTDIGRIVTIIRNEFEEALRKAVEQCMT